MKFYCFGGKANAMNQNMDLALSFFAVYEASGRSLCEAALEEMLDMLMVRRFRKAGRFFNMNRLDKHGCASWCIALRKRLPITVCWKPPNVRQENL